MPLREGLGLIFTIAAMFASAAVHNGLHMLCSTGVIAAFLRAITVFVGCIAPLIRAVVMAAILISSHVVFALSRITISTVYRHERRHGRPGPRPVRTAAISAGFTGAAGAGVIRKTGIVIGPPVGAVGKGPGNAAQGAKSIAAASAGGTTTPAG